MLEQAIALTIAGSDPSGGAGLQADLKTFQQLGVYGMSVVTLLTVQNTREVTAVECLPVEFVERQLDAVLDDIPPRAVKTGALGQSSTIQTVAAALKRFTNVPLVVDPVLVSKHGHSLAGDDVVEAYRKFLLPQTWMVTPNRFEAQRLTGVPVDTVGGASRAAAELQRLGAKNVLIKLGVADGRSRQWLLAAGEHLTFDLPAIEQPSNHGAGCVLSALLTARLARASQLPTSRTAIAECVEESIEAVHRAVSFQSELGGGIHPAETRVL